MMTAPMIRFQFWKKKKIPVAWGMGHTELSGMGTQKEKQFGGMLDNVGHGGGSGSCAKRHWTPPPQGSGTHAGG